MKCSRQFFPGLIAIAGLLCICSCVIAAPENGADIIFYGGPILTVNAKDEEVEALAIQSGIIVAAGTKASVTKEWQGSSTRLMNLGGQTLMPGFIDPHVHLLVTAMQQNFWLDLSNFSANYDTIDSLSAKLRDRLKTLPTGQWLMAFGVDPSRTIPFMAELTADVLDKVSSDVPIWILNESGHLAYVNHKAFEVAGVTDLTPNPYGGGVYEKDARGKLTGVLHEVPAFEAFLGKSSPPSAAELAEGIQKTSKAIASQGVTTTTEITVGALLGMDNEVKLFREITANEGLPIRLRAYLNGLSIRPGFNALKPNDGDDRLRFIGVKFFSDGSTQGLTAALDAPYRYPVGTSDRGALDYQKDDLLHLMQSYFDQGWQIAVHANGDRAIEQTLDNFSQLLAGNPHPETRRLRIEHFTINTPEQVTRAVNMGVIPGFTIGHVDFWGEAFHDRIVGPDRANRIAPGASFKKLGARFAFHSDSPVTPVGPLRYISEGAARIWQKPPQQVLGPDERVAIDDAIRAVTINAAYELMSDDQIGSLEVGKKADLVVLAGNPRNTEPTQIRNIQVKETWIDGKRQNW